MGGSQCLSIRYTGRLAEARTDTSVGNMEESHDNVLAEATVGLFKTEPFSFLGVWKSVARIGWKTLKWVGWHNTGRLHSAVGYVVPQEAEEAFHENLTERKRRPTIEPTTLRQTRAVEPR